jgi:hypothetical protein
MRSFRGSVVSLLSTILAICLFLLVDKVKGQLLLAGGRGKVKLELYRADRTTLVARMVDNMVIDLAKTPSVNVKASAVSRLQSMRVSSVSFYLDDELVETDNDAPYWMLSSDKLAWRPTVGVYVVSAKAYHRNGRNGRKMLQETIRVVVIDSSTNAPVLAPAKLPSWPKQPLRCWHQPHLPFSLQQWRL